MTNPDAFRPLAGTIPATLDDRTGCCWPIEGGKKIMFCDATPNPRSRHKWCDAHFRMGTSATYKTNRDG